MKIDSLYIMMFLERGTSDPKEYVKKRDLKKGDQIILIGVRENDHYNVHDVVNQFLEAKVAKVFHRYEPVLNSNYYHEYDYNRHYLETFVLEIL